MTIQIGADNRKLIADLEIAKSELRKFSTDVNKNVRAGDTTGAAASAASYAIAAEKATALKAALAATNVEAAAFSSHFRDALEHMERFRARIPLGGLSGIGGGLISSIPLSGPFLGVAAAVAGLTALFELAKTGGEHAHELLVVGQALGVNAAQVEQWQKAARRAAVDTELLTRFQERFAIALEKSADAQRKLIIESAKIGANDLGIAARGGGSTEAPKQTSELIDVAKALPKISEQLDEFFFKRYIAFDKALRDTGRPAVPFSTYETAQQRIFGEDSKRGQELRDAAAKSGVPDVPARSMEESLNRQVPGFRDELAKLEPVLEKGTLETRHYTDALNDFQDALGKITKGEALTAIPGVGGRAGIEPNLVSGLSSGAFKGTVDPESEGAREFDAAVNKANEFDQTRRRIQAGFTETQHETGIAIAGWAVDVKNATGAIEGYVSSLDDVPGAAGIAGESFGATIEQLRAVRDMARSAAAAVGAALSGGGGAAGGDFSGTTASGMASGGYIRGPGTGTSDSILARLSNGEYVMSQAAVGRLGVGTLDRMNFGRYLPRFASGGPVGAVSGGGSLGTVVLNLDGQSHHLEARAPAFDQLVQYARVRRLAQIAPRPATAT